MPSHTTDPHGDDAGEPHVLPLSVYWGVFLALVVGTVATVWTATIDLGVMNLVVALAIASIKASLVILFFMHVKFSSKLVWVFAGTGFVFVVLQFAFTLMDFRTRSW